MKRKYITQIIGLALALIGCILFFFVRNTAVAEAADMTHKIFFSVSLIMLPIGILIFIAGLLPPKQPVSIRTLTMAALFAALCYIGFAYFQIKVPVGDSSTSFHLGNVFCVMAALCIGGVWGGLAGSIGMTIGDLLDPVYITSAPKTFVLKLGIGLITGLVAHKIFQISKDKERKVPLAVAVTVSCISGMLFNIIADPLLGYFYKMYILGIPQEAASIWAKIGALTTSVNAVIAVIAATIFYLALRPTLKRTNLLPKM